jgi:drug/metabolite transporter (DMT)-like permease
VDLTGGIYLLLVTLDKVPCSTRMCEVATLDGRHQTAAVVALAAALLLSAAAVFTEGLSRAGTLGTTLLVLVAVLGLFAVIGVVLMAALVLSVLALTLGAVVGIMVGAIRGDLTR